MKLSKGQRLQTTHWMQMYLVFFLICADWHIVHIDIFGFSEVGPVFSKPQSDLMTCLTPVFPKLVLEGQHPVWYSSLPGSTHMD